MINSLAGGGTEGFDCGRTSAIRYLGSDASVTAALGLGLAQDSTTGLRMASSQVVNNWQQASASYGGQVIDTIVDHCTMDR